jgi:3-hydroxyisobutyrate dehydrogenase-like beta-hydroxyacid dehydrogenase
MDKQNIGVLHPGEMGVSLAATLRNGGHTVFWASEGRSEATRRRAAEIGLTDAETLTNLCTQVSTIVSICPPAAAEALAQDVLSAGYRGTYLDANAISPQRAQHIAEQMQAAGATFVDGGVIGGPAWKSGTTWLHLSGSAAAEVAALFAAGPLETNVLGDRAGQASALKMCYAAYTKGTTALLSAVLGAAEALDVRDALAQQWALDGSGLAQDAEKRVRQVTRKAWRFEGEMQEIAATFAGAGMPDGFHLAAADIYARMANLKDADPLPLLDAVLAALLRDNDETKP